MKLLEQQEGWRMREHLDRLLWKYAPLESYPTCGTFITLRKKSRAKKYEDFRTISLMSHPLKLSLKMIDQRICKIYEEQISSLGLEMPWVLWMLSLAFKSYLRELEKLITLFLHASLIIKKHLIRFSMIRWWKAWNQLNRRNKI